MIAICEWRREERKENGKIVGEMLLTNKFWKLLLEKFVWIQDPTILAAIFTEFDRVLKPGGRISFNPSMRWQDMAAKYPFFLDVLKHYQSEQQFWTYVRTSSLPFAYTTHLTKNK